MYPNAGLRYVVNDAGPLPPENDTPEGPVLDPTDDEAGVGRGGRVRSALVFTFRLAREPELGFRMSSTRFLDCFESVGLPLAVNVGANISVLTAAFVPPVLYP